MYKSAQLNGLRFWMNVIVLKNNKNNRPKIDSQIQT